MFAIFTQGASGLNWRASFNTLEEAQEDVRNGEYVDCDAVLIMPVCEGSNFDV